MVGQAAPVDATRVFWDLETTDRVRTSQIVSIGWVWDYDGSSPNELLVLPSDEIASEASHVHGWTRATLIDAGARPCREQLAAFLNDLAHRAPQLVILCAHNGKAFDTHVLRGELEREGLTLPSNVLGFVDTLHWIKYDVGIRSASIDALLRSVGADARTTHSAGEDADILRRIVARYATTPLTYFETSDEWWLRTSPTADKARTRLVFDTLASMVDAVVATATPLS